MAFLISCPLSLNPMYFGQKASRLRNKLRMVSILIFKLDSVCTFGIIRIIKEIFIVRYTIRKCFTFYASVFVASKVFAKFTFR